MSRIIYGPSRSASALRGREISTSAPVDGDALRWDREEEQWRPLPSGGGGVGGHPPFMPISVAGNWARYSAISIRSGAQMPLGPSLMAHPFWSQAGGMLSRLRVRARKGTLARSVRAGLYSNGLFRPGALIVQGPKWELESTTWAYYEAVFAEPISLAENTLYWLAVAVSGTTEISGGGLKAHCQVLGNLHTSNQPLNGVVRHDDFTDDLPSEFGGGAFTTDDLARVDMGFGG